MARAPVRIGVLVIEEAHMTYFHLSRAMKSVGSARTMRKRLQRAASQHKMQAATPSGAGPWRPRAAKAYAPALMIRRRVDGEAR